MIVGFDGAQCIILQSLNISDLEDAEFTPNGLWPTSAEHRPTHPNALLSINKNKFVFKQFKTSIKLLLINSCFNCHKTVYNLIYRFIKHARPPVLILSLRTIDKAIAKHVIVYTAVASLNIWCRASKPFHAIHCSRTF